MNLQDYIQRIKLWINKQYFIIRHYRIVIIIFLVIALGVITVGIFLSFSRGKGSNTIRPIQ